MIKFWQKRIKSPLMTRDFKVDDELKRLRDKLKNEIKKRFAGSLSIRMVSAGSCNACEAECNALSNPYYDLERLGIRFVASPRHADVMLLSGVVGVNMYHHVLDAYAQMPKPSFVISLGDCPILEGVFKESFAVLGADALNIPIDYHIKGCPPTPEEIIKGFLGFLESVSIPEK